jgi:hypothetical protein
VLLLFSSPPPLERLEFVVWVVLPVTFTAQLPFVIVPLGNVVLLIQLGDVLLVQLELPLSEVLDNANIVVDPPALMSTT